MQLKLFRPHYRIVRDTYLGYEVQIRRWWLPVWLQAAYGDGSHTNTHDSEAAAEAFAKQHANPVVRNLGPL